MIKEIIDPLLPLIISCGTVLLASAFIYFAIRYMAHRRAFKLRQRFDFLWAISTILVLFDIASLQFPFEGQVPQPLLNWTAFTAFLLYIYLLVFIIDQFLVEYFLVSALKIYVPSPIRRVIVLLSLAVAIVIGVQIIFDINPWAIYAPTSLISLGIGIALKDSFQMFFAGISLSQIMRIGDWIQVGNYEGEVLDIDWARTVLRTKEGNRLFIPNNELQKQIFINFNIKESRYRCQLEINAAYKFDPEKIKQILLSCATEASGILTDPAPQVFLKSYKDFSVQYHLHFWVTDYAQSPDYCSLVSEKIWHAFKKENIEVPMPTQTVHILSSDKSL